MSIKNQVILKPGLEAVFSSKLPYLIAYLLISAKLDT